VTREREMRRLAGRQVIQVDGRDVALQTQKDVADQSHISLVVPTRRIVRASSGAKKA
jgi:hypothetical protein